MKEGNDPARNERCLDHHSLLFWTEMFLEPHAVRMETNSLIEAVIKQSYVAHNELGIGFFRKPRKERFGIPFPELASNQNDKLLS